jgi:hypothetical protein
MTDDYIYFSDEELELLGYKIVKNILIVEFKKYRIKKAEPRGFYVVIE